MMHPAYRDRGPSTPHRTRRPWIRQESRTATTTSRPGCPRQVRRCRSGRRAVRTRAPMRRRDHFAKTGDETYLYCTRTQPLQERAGDAVRPFVRHVGEQRDESQADDEADRRAARRALGGHASATVSRLMTITIPPLRQVRNPPRSLCGSPSPVRPHKFPRAGSSGAPPTYGFQPVRRSRHVTYCIVNGSPAASTGRARFSSLRCTGKDS